MLKKNVEKIRKKSEKNRKNQKKSKKNQNNFDPLEWTKMNILHKVI